MEWVNSYNPGAGTGPTKSWVCLVIHAVTITKNFENRLTFGKVIGSQYNKW